MEPKKVIVEKYGKEFYVYSRNQAEEMKPGIELSYTVNSLTEDEAIELRDYLNDVLRDD